MSHPVVVSIQVGKPRTFDDGYGEVWRSAIVKRPVNNPVFLGKTNLEGDGQADLSFRGGPEKAVLVYAADHYEKWLRELMLLEFPYGALGDFTVTGLDEHNV